MVFCLLTLHKRLVRVCAYGLDLERIPMMRRHAIALQNFLWIFVFIFPLHSEEVASIVEKIDRLFRSQSSQAEIVMTISTPHWKRQVALDAWSEGMEKTFVRIKSPKKDRGVATLRRGKEMWNYFPKIDKTIKVPPSMMMGSWMGSDFSNDDLVRESSLLHDYRASFVLDESIPVEHVLISLKPKEKTISVWGEIHLLVQKNDGIPIRETYYNERREKIRVLHFKKVKNLGGKKIPSVLEMIPLKKKGYKTVIEYKKALFDQDLPKGLFTLRNLKKKC